MGGRFRLIGGLLVLGGERGGDVVEGVGTGSLKGSDIVRAIIR